MKKLKTLKILSIIWFFLMIVISSNCVLGHPASNVYISYNFNEQRLTVTISHNTDNKETHYIEKVEVYKNGVNIIDEDYTSQTSSNTFTLSFNVSANDGDILKVETECIRGGNTEDSLTVKSTENVTSNENGDKSTPGFELILLGLSIAFILFLRRKRI